MVSAMRVSLENLKLQNSALTYTTGDAMEQVDGARIWGHVASEWGSLDIVNVGCCLFQYSQAISVKIRLVFLHTLLFKNR